MPFLSLPAAQALARRANHLRYRFFCPAPRANIFRFALTPNQTYKFAVPSSSRGAYRDRHGRWDGMRWTRRCRARDAIAGRVFGLVSDQAARKTNGAEADGKA